VVATRRIPKLSSRAPSSDRHATFYSLDGLPIGLTDCRSILYSGLRAMAQLPLAGKRHDWFGFALLTATSAGDS